MLRLLIALLAGVLIWATLGRLDIVAVADGKLVPSSYLIRTGEVLIRMDTVLSSADVKTTQAEHDHRRLALRRIDAQLAGTPLLRGKSDPAELFVQVEAQYAANVRAYENALAQERALLEKAKNDLEAARQTKAKLEQVLPHYVEQEKAFEKLTRDGFAGRMMYSDKQRERIEKEQDLRTQEFAIRAGHALIEQSEQKIAQITADYRRQLQTERVETAAQYDRSRQELAKHSHRHQLLELRAPQAGIVKDLATHTSGTVVSPGAILMTLVPEGDKLVAEVWVSNQDVGFVRPGMETKLKIAAFQFQKYGLLEGRVAHVNADATEAPSPNMRSDALTGRDRPMGPLAFRTLVELGSEELLVEGRRYSLHPGMQVASEIHLGTRTVLEYLLSPVQKAFQEAGRER